MIPPEQFHFCNDCQKFTIDPEKKQASLYPNRDKEGSRSDIFFFDATLEDVLTGLTSGCELCLWLDSLWREELSSDQERYAVLKASKNTSSIVVCAETYSMSLVDRYPIDEITFFGLWEENVPSRPHWGKCLVFGKCSIDIFTTQDDDVSHLIRNRPINCYPGSAESLKLVRQWLQKCQTSHAKCRGVSQSYIPLRVLRISGGCSSCEFHVAIDTTTKTEPFAALSYCWGGEQPYKTTKARIQSGDASLQWCKLSKSLQDAIKVTVALGLQCLWVDSMCIIQDDEDDKAVQIADMARIYSQATVTIVASRSSRAVDGFLGEINLTSRTLLAVRLPFRCSGKDRTVGSAYLTHIEGSRNRSEPIESRAWTLQERYLSNRVVEFGSLQTGWTCSSSSASTAKSGDSYVDGWKWDTNHEASNSQMIYLHSDLLVDLAEFALQRSSDAWIRDWLNSRWETVLSEYTPRLLSVPTDRILGISGVADIFLSHRRNEGRDKAEEYLAGLWKSSLPSMLCWHAVGDQGRLPPAPEIYQGPSWSWAGINCHVSFIFGRACNTDCRAVLVDADVRLANSSAKCGSVTRAVLTLKGRMRRGFWNSRDRTLDVDSNENPVKGGDARDSCTNTTRVRLATIYPDTSGPRGGSSREHQPRVPIQLLEIGNCVSLKRRGPVGLVLELTQVSSDQDLPQFRRLGLFHIDTKRISGATQPGYAPNEHSQAEAPEDFFDGRIARVIKLECFHVSTPALKSAKLERHLLTAPTVASLESDAKTILLPHIGALLIMADRVSRSRARRPPPPPPQSKASQGRLLDAAASKSAELLTAETGAGFVPLQSKQAEFPQENAQQSEVEPAMTAQQPEPPKPPKPLHTSVLELETEEQEQVSPVMQPQKRQIGSDDDDEHQPKRARLTRKNLARFNNIGKKGTKTSLSSTIPDFTTGSTTTSGFDLRASKNGILNSISSKPPTNLKEIRQRYTKSRGTASPTESMYEGYVKGVKITYNEATTIFEVGRRLLKDYDENYRKALNHAFTGFPEDVGFNNGLSAPQPGFVEGLQKLEFEPFLVEEHINGAVLYKDNRHSITLPHLAGEWKGPDGLIKEAALQSSYDGAALVYARNQALAYLGKSDPPGHAEITTFATDGTNLNFYAHYATLSENGTLKYHQYQYASANILDSYQGHKDGRRGLRNAQDYAFKQSCALKDQLKEKWKQHRGALQGIAEGPLPPVVDGTSEKATNVGEDEVGDKIVEQPCEPTPPSSSEPEPLSNSLKPLSSTNDAVPNRGGRKRKGAFSSHGPPHESSRRRSKRKPG
ncbi:hypothetical protein O1611_g3765 [Lasiodiplodia mahajangana]|uniref:Uncharacterized protein n=1 Tax=Lasiodiplodia mahajangana TaxID=1108764 RepID=A0ACC2JQT1_9PEZI|nr:hypothetical protein O1611_g3765 [Lasiodiplodia mahajangana]